MLLANNPQTSVHYERTRSLRSTSLSYIAQIPSCLPFIPSLPPLFRSSFALPPLALLTSWRPQTRYSPHSLSSVSYSVPFRCIGTWKVNFVQRAPSSRLSHELTVLAPAASPLPSSSVECRHFLVYGLGWPGLFECFHQLGRLEPLCRKCRPRLV